MYNGLAIWHYPHRTMARNISFFASHGFPSLSVHGARLVEELYRDEGREVAQAVISSGVYLTVHYALPRRHDEGLLDAFQKGLLAINEWQRRYGVVKILSFDVPHAIRDRAYPYIDMALDMVEGCKIAVEDFGLTAEELAQMEHLRSNQRFGYLVDMGHMFIRMRGLRQDGRALFSHADLESPILQDPTAEDFQKALQSKDFPIFEIHLHNNDGVQDSHLFLPDGEMRIPEVAKALKAIDYQGVLTIESAPGYQFDCYGEDADRGILETYNYWKCLQNS